MTTTKNILVTLTLAIGLASPAMALSIQGGSVDVGALDTVVGVRTGRMSSSPASETAWVSSILGAGYSVNANISGANILNRTDAPGAPSYAFNLQGLGTPPASIEYVLVKNGTTMLLLQNDGSTDWAAFNWADSVQIGSRQVAYDLNGRGSNRGQRSISHFALVSGPTLVVDPPPFFAPQELPQGEPVNVPEPATLGLMGLGLLTAGLRRKRKAG
ncbi:MAG: hypothetical protein RLZZ200_3026 [Pseudomonadota bacterium]|jgi:hypothetical protein